MISDQVNDGDGDIPQNGGQPKLPVTPPRSKRLVLARRGQILSHVKKAMGMGLPLPDALHGTGVSAKTVRRWLAQGSAK